MFPVCQIILEFICYIFSHFRAALWFWHIILSDNGFKSARLIHGCTEKVFSGASRMIVEKNIERQMADFILLAPLLFFSPGTDYIFKVSGTRSHI